MRARNLQNHVILVRTCYDDTTEHTYRWSEEIRCFFEENGWKVTDIEFEEATREPVEAALQAAEPGSVFLFYGHGYADHLEGRDGNPVCDEKSALLLAKCKIYTVACHSTLKLGKAVVEKHGGSVYFGYADEIKGYWGKRNPHGEEMMGVFGECVNAGMRIWLARPRLTAREIEQKMKAVYQEGLDYYNKHFLKSPDIDYMAVYRFASKLNHNMDALELLGDKNMCLTCPVS